MCHKIQVANEIINKNGVRRGPFQKAESLQIGSYDVKSCFPSIDTNLDAEDAKSDIEESDLEVEVDTEEVALFLASTMSQEEIDIEGLQHVVHKRRYKMGSRPGLTSESIAGGPVVRAANDSWITPARKPTRRQQMRMIGCFVRSAIKLVMNNHFYTFDNTKKTKGWWRNRKCINRESRQTIDKET